jgi:hypothetical protein
VAGHKTSRPVLIYLAPNHLFYEVPDYIRGRRDSLERKLINLTNESLFLHISKEFMEKRGSSRLGGSSAYMPTHHRHTLEIVFFSYSSIIRDQLPI